MPPFFRPPMFNLLLFFPAGLALQPKTHRPRLALERGAVKHARNHRVGDIGSKRRVPGGSAGAESFRRYRSFPRHLAMFLWGTPVRAIVFTQVPVYFGGFEFGPCLPCFL